MTALGFPAYIELARSDIEVSPIVLDLGDVDVGLSAAQVVTVTNLGGADLVVTDIGFEGGVGSDFSISAAPALLATLLLDETADVEITFAPTALGAASAILQITSNDPDQGLVEVMLSGTGVVLDPSDALGTILVFFDQSVTDGTLVGSGPGGSGAMRLTALRNMLEAAGDLIDVGQAEKACNQLLDAYLRTDGVFPPPDFVAGTAAPELATQIQDLRTSMGCARTAISSASMRLWMPRSRHLSAGWNLTRDNRMPIDHREQLSRIRTFPSLVKYLRDELVIEEVTASLTVGRDELVAAFTSPALGGCPHFVDV